MGIHCPKPEEKRLNRIPRHRGEYHTGTLPTPDDIDRRRSKNRLFLIPVSTQFLADTPGPVLCLLPCRVVNDSLWSRSECRVTHFLAGHRNTRQAPSGPRCRRSARAQCDPFDIGQFQFLAGDKVDRLLFALVDRNVRSIKISPIMSIADGIQPALQPEDRRSPPQK